MALNPENIDKKIKKYLYGKPQAVQAICPAGMDKIALNEVQFILNNLWFKQKYVSEFSLTKNIIHIEPIHLFAVTELLMRSQSLSDIRLIIFSGNASGKSIFKKKCLDINWQLYLNKKMSLKIKVNSVASRAFHESGLKEILSEILEEYVDEIVSGEHTQETTSLFVNLYKNKLVISISLAGEPLYKRGYRDVLPASAPLREDVAFCCLRRAVEFADNGHTALSPPYTVLVPFSGTGTFVFEYLQYYFKFSPVLFARDYAMQKMSFFREENFNFLLKKAKEHVLSFTDDINFICIDHSKEAMSACLTNMSNIEKVFKDFSANAIQYYEKDFFNLDFSNIIENKNVFMPLNPPYGIRIGKNMDSVNFYKKIADKVNEILEITLKLEKKLVGFILCPDENTWSKFCKIIKNMKTETYHFTQGGLDIRVCQFTS